MGDDEFRLPGSSYDELTKIIRGYGHYDADVPLSEIAQVVGMHPTVVSRNNAFLVSTGIVQGGQRKAMTPSGKSLARALDHNIPDEISRSWREVVSGNQFIQKLLAAVRIRRGMDPSTLQAHVAYSAGQKKSQAVMAGAAAVVEIMRAAGLLREQNGKLVVPDEASVATDSEAVVSEGIATTNVPRTSEAEARPTSHWTSAPSRVNVTIQLQIQCTPDELNDDLSRKLRNLIAGLDGTNSR
jgi:hypothetical protein